MMKKKASHSYSRRIQKARETKKVSTILHLELYSDGPLLMFVRKVTKLQNGRLSSLSSSSFPPSVLLPFVSMMPG